MVHLPFVYTDPGVINRSVVFLSGTILFEPQITKTGSEFSNSNHQIRKSYILIETNPSKYPKDSLIVLLFCGDIEPGTHLGAGGNNSKLLKGLG